MYTSMLTFANNAVLLFQCFLGDFHETIREFPRGREIFTFALSRMLSQNYFYIIRYDFHVTSRRQFSRVRSLNVSYLLDRVSNAKSKPFLFGMLVAKELKALAHKFPRKP